MTRAKFVLALLVASTVLDGFYLLSTIAFVLDYRGSSVERVSVPLVFIAVVTLLYIAHLVLFYELWRHSGRRFKLPIALFGAATLVLCALPDYVQSNEQQELTYTNKTILVAALFVACILGPAWWLYTKPKPRQHNVR